MKKVIIGIYRDCDFVTMISSLFGIVGIILALKGEIYLAIFSLIMSGICDSFDGVLARRHDNSKKEMIYGCEMDSLSDIMCFGVLPTVISICDGINMWWAYIIYALYILAGLIRLAYYNTLYHVEEDSKGYFIGIPITSVAIVYPIFWTIFRFKNLLYSNIVIPIMFLILSILYIIRVKIKKVNTKGKIALAILGIAFITAIILIKHVL